ncbi:hypothetical protein V8C34DRAFT_316325 [Trichoderma compactum]
MDSNHYCLRDASAEIRLFDLSLANEQEPMQGRIRHATIDDVFVAVSHVWGNKSSDRSIPLESSCGTRYAQISANLEAFFTTILGLGSTALPQPWSKGSRLPLWVDMICINQMDGAEKALQIPLMRDIYSQANTAADIWTLFDPNGWEALKNLLECSWFHQRWVPKNVMSIDDLFSGVDKAASVLIARPRKFKILYPAHTESLRPAPALRELGKHYAEPDYHVAGNPIRYNLEPGEVYKTFAATHARLYNNLEFLGLCTAAQRDFVCSGSVDKLVSRSFASPTWVPNWHSERLQRCLGLSDYGTNLKFFNASDRIPTTVLFRYNELEVSYVRLDRTLSIGRFCRLERRHELTDPNSRLLLGIFLNPMPLLADIPDMFCRWCRGSNLGRRLAGYGLKPKNARNLEGERVFMGMRRLTAWEPFITESGYIGLARGNSRVGDEIWLVGGNPVSFEVNGEVFFDGFMFGEPMTIDEFGDTSVQRIALV